MVCRDTPRGLSSALPGPGVEVVTKWDTGIWGSQSSSFVALMLPSF